MAHNEGFIPMSVIFVGTPRPGVIYRPGRPTAEDYTEAVEALELAAEQLEPDGNSCIVCGDSGHQAFECHHNPLLMARRAIAATNVFRCYHCGFVGVTQSECEEHFGADPRDDPDGDHAPACVLQRVKDLGEIVRDAGALIAMMASWRPCLEAMSDHQRAVVDRLLERIESTKP